MLTNFSLISLEIFVATQAIPIVWSGDTCIFRVVFVLKEDTVESIDFLLQVEEGLFGVILVGLLVHKKIEFVEAVPDFHNLLLTIGLIAEFFLKISNQTKQVSS